MKILTNWSIKFYVKPIIDAKNGSKNYRATANITTQNSPSEILFPIRVFKTSIPDFIDNKDKVKEEEIRKKEAQLRENKICLNNMECKTMQQ